LNRAEFEMLLAEERRKNLVVRGHSGTGVYFVFKKKTTLVLLIHSYIHKKYIFKIYFSKKGMHEYV